MSLVAKAHRFDTKVFELEIFWVDEKVLSLYRHELWSEPLFENVLDW